METKIKIIILMMRSVHDNVLSRLRFFFPLYSKNAISEKYFVLPVHHMLIIL